MSHWDSVLALNKHTASHAHVLTCCFNLRSLSPLRVYISFCLLSLPINIQLKVQKKGGLGRGYMNSDHRFIMFFFSSSLFSHELWSASTTGTFSGAASKLNAVCRRATQEQTGQAGIYWLVLLRTKHLFTPQCFQAEQPLRYSARRLLKMSFFSFFYSNLVKKAAQILELKAAE